MHKIEQIQVKSFRYCSYQKCDLSDCYMVISAICAELEYFMFLNINTFFTDNSNLNNQCLHQHWAEKQLTHRAASMLRILKCFSAHKAKFELPLPSCQLKSV